MSQVTEYWDGTEVVDRDKPFKIDPVTREIHYDGKKKVLMQNDHQSERFTFEVPRFIEGRDVGSCNVVQIYYINAKNRSSENSTGVYTVTDMEIYPFVNDRLTFTWLISKNATSIAGTLSFMVRFANVDDDGKVLYAWNSDIYTEIVVSDSLESDAVFEEEYVDVIQQWKIETMVELRDRVDYMVENNINVAQIDVNKNNISTLSGKQDTLEARMDEFTSLPEGSTTGDAELADIRVGANGITYENAGDAVRGQYAEVNNILNENSPFNMMSFISRRYYKHSMSSTAYNELSQTVNMLDLDYYLSIQEETTDTLQAVSCGLKTPIDVFSSGGDYTLFINSDIEDRVIARFTSGIHWGDTETSVTSQTLVVKPGFNVLKLNFVGFNDAGHSQFNYFSIQSTSLDSATKYEAFLSGSGFMADYLKDELESLHSQLVYTPLDTNMNIQVKNCVCDAVYENSLLTVNIPEKTTEEPEWRFAIVSFSIGSDISGSKLLVKKNTNNIRSFGIGVNTTQWAAKNFDMDNDIQLIDVEEFVQSHPTLAAHTGDYYVVVGIELGNSITYNSSRTESVNILTLNKEMASSISPINRLAGFDPNKYVAKAEFESSVMDIFDEAIAEALDDSKMIICWGDSLTAGGGWTEKLQTLSGLTVKNCGTGGENTNTISARQGADCIVVNGITIPAGVSPVQLTDYQAKFTTYFGMNAMPLLQGGTQHVNPCMLGGIEGTLAWTGSSYSDTTGVWTFTRSVAGNEVIVNRPVQLTTFADREYNNGRNIHIFFTGTNDGRFDVDDHIAKLRRMIDRAGTDEYLILGLTRIYSSDYKSKMKPAFGRKWLDLHEYLVNYGMEDAGLTPTEEDVTAINGGLVPPSLLTDSVHYQNVTKELIGIQVYNRMRDLHYFN